MSNTQLTTTEWARAHGVHHRGTIVLDNYEPHPRDETTLDCWSYDLGDDPRGSGWIIDGGAFLNMGTRAIWLMDDGRTVVPFYTASWHPDHGHVIAHPFPVNFHADGSPVLRADSSQPVSFDNWQLGPHRAYHVKLRVAS